MSTIDNGNMTSSVHFLATNVRKIPASIPYSKASLVMQYLNGNNDKIGETYRQSQNKRLFIE